MQMMLCVFVAFVITAMSGFLIIPVLHKLNFGQTILDIGPSWHKNKEGTPTMGGIMFVIGIIFSCALGFVFIDKNDSASLIRFSSGILMALGYGLLGFIDDYMKVVKHQNEGLTAKQKFIGQILLAIAYLIGIKLTGSLSTMVAVPFIGQFDLGFLYYPIAVFIIVGTSNSVNLTDGIDGLCSSVTAVCALGFVVMSSILKYNDMGYLACALLGGCLGFLLWNHHPAKVFMGDTGSLFLGGMVCALAFGIEFPIVLIFSGIVYVLETLSDIIQIGSFKIRHKRVFKMAPIHHHFEMCGWSEWKIVIVFSAVAFLGSILSVLATINL